MRKQWLKFGVIQNHISFKNLRSLCIRQPRIHRSVYIDGVEQNSSENSKYFWSYVNKLSKSNTIPDKMFF